MKDLRLIGVGTLVGVATAAVVLIFSVSVDALSGAFQACHWLVLALPVAGVAAYFLYRLLKVPFSTNTPSVLGDVIAGRKVPLALVPSIFAGTCLSIFAGGSVGKEAAALQMGASISSSLGERTRLSGASDGRVLSMCGMASALSVLLGAPLASVAFAFELFRRRGRWLVEIAAVACASFASWGLSLLATADNMRAVVAVPAFSLDCALFVLVVAVGGSAVSAVFCLALQYGKVLASKIPQLAAIVGCGIACAAVLLLTDGFAYSGTGMAQVADSLAGSAGTAGSAGDVGLGADFGLGFLWKLLLTAALLAFGFKGGEIMPSLCIGALFGGFVGGLAGSLLGVGSDLSAFSAFSAALGMVVVFAACTNCPIAAFLLGIESFGIAGLPAYAVGAALAFVLTSRVGLYPNVLPLRDAFRWGRDAQ